MRGAKETLGGMKEGIKSKARAAGKAAAAGSKGAAKTAGRDEAGPGSLSGSRKVATKKGGASK